MCSIDATGFPSSSASSTCRGHGTSIIPAVAVISVNRRAGGWDNVSDAIGLARLFENQHEAIRSTLQILIEHDARAVIVRITQG